MGAEQLGICPSIKDQVEGMKEMEGRRVGIQEGGCFVVDVSRVHQAPSSSSGTGVGVKGFLTNCSECSRSTRMGTDMVSSQGKIN